MRTEDWIHMSILRPTKWSQTISAQKNGIKYSVGRILAQISPRLCPGQVSSEAVQLAATVSYILLLVRKYRLSPVPVSYPR